MSFLSLSNELILEITTYLSPPCVAHLLLCNRYLSNLLATAPIDALFRIRSEHHGTRALLSAAERGDTPAVAALLHRGILNLISTPTPTNSGKFLVDAVRTLDDRIISTLLEAGIPVNAGSSCGQTPLSAAATNGRVGVVRMLLERPELDPNYPDGIRGMTPLMHAVERSHGEIARLLLADARTLVTLTGGKGRETAFVMAIRCDAEGIVREFLRHAEVDVAISAAVRTGDSSLKLAVECAGDGVVGTLLQDSRVDVDFSGADGVTALHVGVMTGRVNAVRMIVESGRVDVHATCGDGGDTALGIAVRKGYKEIEEVLLKAGAGGPPKKRGLSMIGYGGRRVFLGY
ncbi:ankyrin [Tuber magnatum]|uniref:Ankyrin n=1 Tax=Tuber magnatum TaxID=42249 RepID=A0A317SMQ5_9PEZI|nr:ankyrin [Tuber magnatum]